MARTLSHTADQSTPDALFNGLPQYIKDQICKCPNPDLKVLYKFWSASIEPSDANRSIQEKVSRRPPLGMYCLLCLRYTKYTISGAVRSCDGCDNYYLPRISSDTWPIKYFLCERCDNVPTRNR